MANGNISEEEKAWEALLQGRQDLIRGWFTQKTLPLGGNRASQSIGAEIADVRLSGGDITVHIIKSTLSILDKDGRTWLPYTDPSDPRKDKFSASLVDCELERSASPRTIEFRVISNVIWTLSPARPAGM